jgi:hypothetical protein
VEVSAIGGSSKSDQVLLVEEYYVPTWASVLALHLHLDALNLHLTILNLYPDQNSHLNKSWHVHAHPLR